MYPKVSFYGADDRIDCLTHIVQPNEEVKIGSLKISCLFTPCHTSGHMCYYVREGSKTPVVFTGDTLFVAGCGKFFEGTPLMVNIIHALINIFEFIVFFLKKIKLCIYHFIQMYQALVDVLGKLPKETLVYCGHEYTVKNLEFARYADKHNDRVKDKLAWAKEMRKNMRPTIPTTIGYIHLFI